MKTCDEIIEENFTNQFTHSEKVIIKQLMQIVHRQACKEQRKIIAKELPDECFMPVTDIDESFILSAKTPELK